MRTVRAYHPHNVKSVLVVELARLGDVVSMIPSLRLFRRHFADRDTTARRMRLAAFA